MRTIEERAIQAIIKANEKASKLISIGLEPAEEQDELENVLLGMLQRDMSEESAGELMFDLYCASASASLIYNKYFITNID